MSDFELDFGFEDPREPAVVTSNIRDSIELYDAENDDVKDTPDLPDEADDMYDFFQRILNFISNNLILFTIFSILLVIALMIIIYFVVVRK